MHHPGGKKAVSSKFLIMPRPLGAESRGRRLIFRSVILSLSKRSLLLSSCQTLSVVFLVLRQPP